MAWAGTTPVLGGLCRPSPTHARHAERSGVVPAHADCLSTKRMNEEAL